MSAWDFAALVVNSTKTIFDPDEISDDYQFFDFFEKSVNKAAQRSTELLGKFHLAMNSGKSGEKLIKKFKLDRDARLLVEVEDIRDELDILAMVLQDQTEVTDKLHQIILRIEGTSMTTDESLRLDTNRVSASHIAQIERMKHVAYRTTQTLYRLIDSKQKHASVYEAMAANQSAAAATRQGRTLTLFTVVTIIFLPLSFMAAFFAINIDAFPTNERGDMSLSYVVKYLVGISMAVSLPFIIIVFNMDRMMAVLRSLTLYTDTINTMGWTSLMIAAVALIAAWASDISLMASIAVTTTASLFIIVYLCGVGMYRPVPVGRIVEGGVIDEDDESDDDNEHAMEQGNDPGTPAVEGIIGPVREAWRHWRQERHGRRRESMNIWMAEQGAQGDATTDDSGE